FFIRDRPTPGGERVARGCGRGGAPPVPAPLGGTDAGLDVLPANDVEPPINLADPQLAEQPYAAQPQARGARNVPLVNPRRVAGAAPGIAGDAAAAEPSVPASSCMLIDRQSGRTYTLTGPAVTIGRERNAGGVVLHDPNISRRHAELTYDGRDWRIRDLNSTNGTLVNDVDVDECILRTGDLVTLGLTNLEFREN
ncbi:FHA domain-containing protein, partial [Atopobiaceae bacterium Sow4_H2]